jgi:hypothetical protein
MRLPGPDGEEGRELNDTEADLVAQFQPTSTTPDDTHVVEGAVEGASGGDVSPAVPLPDAPIVPPAEPVVASEGAGAPSPELSPPLAGDGSADDGFVDFLGQRIARDEAEAMGSTWQWLRSLTPEQLTAVDAAARAQASVPQVATPTPAPTPDAPAGAVPPASVPPSQVPAPALLSDDDLADLDPSTAHVVRALQQQNAALQQHIDARLEPLQQGYQTIAQAQLSASQAELNALADTAVTTFMAAHEIDPTMRAQLEAAAAPYSVYALNQGGSPQQVFQSALETAYYATEPFRSQAIDREASARAEQLHAANQATRAKAAKSGALASSPASVPRDTPAAAPNTKAERQLALVSAIEEARSNGQRN